MATRHLYTQDCVAATLLYALQHGKTMLAIQTFKELYVSEEPTLLWNILSLAWFLSPPNHPQQRQRYEAFVAGDANAFLSSLLDSATELPSLPSYDVLEPPTQEGRAPPATWKRKPNGWTEGQAGALYYAVKNAIERGSWLRASRLTVPFLDGNRLAFAELLQSLGVAKKLTDTFCMNVPLSVRILEHAFASLVAKPTVSKPTFVDLTTDNTKSHRNWSVSPSACALWGVSAPPTTDMVGAPLLIMKEPTTFWKNAIRDFGVTASTTGLVIAEDRIEEFYDTYFPSDIPDEWSSEERQKSHGFAVPASLPNPWRTAFVLCWS
jgi:hypothetical protein